MVNVGVYIYYIYIYLCTIHGWYGIFYITSVCLLPLPHLSEVAVPRLDEIGVSFSWRQKNLSICAPAGPNTDKRCGMVRVYSDSDILSRRTAEY